MRSRTKRRRLCAVSRCAEAAAERPAPSTSKIRECETEEKACCGFFREACVVVVRRVGTGLRSGAV